MPLELGVEFAAPSRRFKAVYYSALVMGFIWANGEENNPTTSYMALRYCDHGTRLETSPLEQYGISGNSI